MTRLPRNYWRIIAGVFATLIVFAINVGYALPLFALALDQVGASATEVGLNSGIQAIGVVLAGVVAPRLYQRYGAVRTIVGGTSINAAIDVVMAFWVDPWIWLPLRFFGGLTGATVFVIGEAWIVRTTPDAIRGRVLSIYAGGVAAAFAVGPMIVPLVGVSGYLPYFVLAGITAITLIPIWIARRDAPEPEGKKQPALLSVVRRAPVAAVAVLLFGIMESAQFTNFPLYALRHGLDQSEAAWLVATIGMGGILLLAPMGWLADRIDRRMLLRLAALAGCVGYALLPAAIQEPAARMVVLFVIGGIAGSIYPISLALLGERFKGDDLAAASGVIIGMYAIGALIGPPVLGAAMDTAGADAMPAVLASMAGAFALLAGGLGLTAKR